MSRLTKLIYDPIHGYMSFDKDCLDIIDTITFKRLQNIKQMGTCDYVFPGATHSRFIHSLGVAYLAEKMIKNISLKQPELNISDREILLVKIAGLCHDLGHGPFSHAFDNEILPNLIDNIEPLIHEKRSMILLRNIISEEKLNYTENEMKFIEICIYPSKDDISKLNKPYLYEIISNPFNGIDVDKFDYLKRDPYHLGLDYHFNCERLLEEARVIGGHISYPKKLANSIINMFSVRYRCLREICNHPVVKSIEYMICDAILESESVLNLKDTVDNEKFADITDFILHQIEVSNNVNLENAKNTLKNIKKRNLYKYIGEVNLPTTIDNTLLNKFNIKKKDIIIHNLKLSYSNTFSFPLENVLFYDYNNIDKHFKITKDDFYMVMPNCFNEINTIRIFSRENEKNITSLYNYLKQTK